MNPNSNKPQEKDIAKVAVSNLRSAILRGESPIEIKPLLDNIVYKADINEVIDLIQNAVFSDNPKVVKMLLEYSRNSNEPNKETGQTPLEYAILVCKGNLEVIDEILKSGAKPDLANEKTGITPLMSAIYKGNLEVIEKLLEKGANQKGANPNVPNEKTGETPLEIAIRKGDLKVVEKLLEYKADPNVPNGKTGQTPIEYAISSGRYDIAEKLLDYSVGFVDIDEPNKKGVTLLEAAISSGKYGVEEIVRKLLKRGADASKPNKEGFTPLETAAISSNQFGVLRELFRELIASKEKKYDGYDINKLLKGTGKTILELAVTRSNISDVKSLLACGAKPTTAAFRLAVAEGKDEIAKILLPKGSNALRYFVGFFKALIGFTETWETASAVSRYEGRRNVIKSTEVAKENANFDIILKKIMEERNKTNTNTKNENLFVGKGVDINNDSKLNNFHIKDVDPKPNKY